MPAAKKAAKKDRAARAKAKAKATAEAKAARAAARKAEEWLEADMVRIVANSYHSCLRLYMLWNARKAAQRTENLRRKRLRADGKAGAARSEEEAGRPLVPRGITRMVTDAARPLPHGATCAQRGTGSGRQMRRGSVTDCLQRTPAARKPRLRPTQ